MIVTTRPYRCGLCRTLTSQHWAQINWRFGVADLDQRSRDCHGPLECSVQRCPVCGLAARRIDRVRDDFARAAIASAPYATLRARADLPRLAQTYLMASYVERARGFAGRAAWFALCAGWVCDDEGNQAGALDARSIAIERLTELHGRKVKIAQGYLHSAPAGTTELIFADTLRKLGRFSDAKGMLLHGLMFRSGPIHPPLPWMDNAEAFEMHLIGLRDSANYTQDDADAWVTRETFARVPPIRTLGSAGGGASPEARAARPPIAPDPPAPSGVLPVFFWLEGHRGFSSTDPIRARYTPSRQFDSERVEELDVARTEVTLQYAIDSMFPAMHRTWTCDQNGPFIEKKRRSLVFRKPSRQEWNWLITARHQPTAHDVDPFKEARQRRAKTKSARLAAAQMLADNEYRALRRSLAGRSMVPANEVRARASGDNRRG